MYYIDVLSCMIKEVQAIKLLFGEVRYVMRHEGYRRPIGMFYKEGLNNLL